MNDAVDDAGTDAEEVVTIVVLGMHRSGTSMIGGLLEALGVNMGEEFKPGTTLNPTGFFEDVTFLRLNRKMLRAAGGHHLAPPTREAIAAQKDVFAHEVQQLIQRKMARRWGWKDPRTSLTLPLYIEHLPDPRLIVCRRDVAAIAKSLQTRGDMNVEDGVRLAKVYEDHLRSFFMTHDTVPRLEVAYEAITEDAEPWIQRLIDFLDLEPTTEQRARARALVLSRKKLRTFKWKRLLKRGIQRPWDVPRYVLDRIRHRSTRA